MFPKEKFWKENSFGVSYYNYGIPLQYSYLIKKNYNYGGLNSLPS